MANGQADLEALRITREDLFALALRLGQHRIETSPSQLLEAHDLLLGLRLAGSLPEDRRAWAGYLAPVFCRSEAEQTLFHQVFPEWVASQPQPKSATQSAALLEKNRIVAGVAEAESRSRGRHLFVARLLILCGLWMVPSPLSVEAGIVPKPQPATEETTQPITPTAKTTPKQATFPVRPLERNIPPVMPLYQWDFTSAQLAVTTIASPWVLLSLWLLGSYIMRRIVLTKQPDPSPDTAGNYWFKGSDEALFQLDDFSRAGARFREPVSRITRRIHPIKTLAATVRKAGLYTPVFRRRRHHPEHLVLIDRASQPGPAAQVAGQAVPYDHLAAFGEILMAHLCAEQVITHVYYFDRDPRFCRTDGGREGVWDLAGLQALHGECRLLVLTDAAGLFDALSGQPLAWLEEFKRWPLRVVLTPKPVAEWDYPEAILALHGFAVAPLDPHSLDLLADVWLPLALREDTPAEVLQQVRLLAPLESRKLPPLPAAISRYGDRWLEPISPKAQPVRELLAELREYLGEDGFLLLQALAVYPELRWPLSLYVDWVLDRRYAEWKLVDPAQSPARRAQRLLSLARLPWLRHGRMPDYLRLALVRKLRRTQRRYLVQEYNRLLQAVTAQGPHAIALEIAPRPKQTVWQRLKFWQRGTAHTSTDRIFAKVLLGGKPGWLDVELPAFWSKLLPGMDWNSATVRLLMGFIAAAFLSTGSYLLWAKYRPAVDSWLMERQLARHGAMSVAMVKALTSDWQEGPLVDALTGGGFAPRMEAEPAESTPVVPLRPKAVWGGQDVIVTGTDAQAAGRWIARRLSYLNYGRHVLLNPDASPSDSNGLLSPDPSPRQIRIWLADVPPTFQDGLDYQPPPPPPVFIEPDMARLPGGKFLMGSPKQEQGFIDDEGPQHWVTIAPFALGKTEVTFDEYFAFVQATGRKLPDDAGFGRGKRPVINVSWDDAQAYAAWLSEKTGKQYRLPTEAEWEYAARAGSQTARYWGDDRDNRLACAFANVYDRKNQAEIQKRYSWAGTSFDCDDDYPFTAPVGQFKPNAWGLYDMLGNVWEWVADCYHDNYQGAPTDGRSWEDKVACQSGRRVLRGGSWGYGPPGVRAAYRNWDTPGTRNYLLGFRLARTP